MPAWLLPAVMGAGVLGDFFGGNAQAKAGRDQIKEQKRQFDLQFGLEKRGADDRRGSVQRTTPVREEIMRFLLSKFGLEGAMPGAMGPPSGAPPVAPRGGGPLIPGAAGGGGGGGGLRPEILMRLLGAGGM